MQDVVSLFVVFYCCYFLLCCFVVVVFCVCLFLSALVVPFPKSCHIFM